MQDILRFVVGGNAKLPSYVVTFSLPSGHSCPGALDCLSKADRKNGGIVDGANTKFRCFSASQECTYPNVRESRWHNMDLVRKAGTSAAIRDLILKSLPDALMVRIHVGGDFFNQAYFDAWLEVAAAVPDTVFYAYTKSLAFWVNRLDSIPDNFRLTASRGGRYDDLIEQHGLVSAEVVYHPEAAAEKGLPIDHDDSHARDKNRHSFALLLHGCQPPKSEASAAIQRMRAENVEFSYNKGRQVKLQAAVVASR